MIYKNCMIKINNDFLATEYSITDLNNGVEIMSGISTASANDVIKELKEQIRVYREDPEEFMRY